MTTTHEQQTQRRFRARLAAREVSVGVVGLGYTGLPLAVAAAQAGFTTFGYDSDAELCARLNRGVSHIEDVPDGAVRALVQDGRLRAVSLPLAPTPDVVFLCVPTPYNGAPDLSYVRSAAAAVARSLRPDMLVVSQSTSYPGTTTDVIQPLLEESGLRAGVDFHLAFAPERIDPASPEWNIHNTPRVVGGVTAESTRRAAAALGAIVGDEHLIRQVRSPAVAEFAKLLENSYRLVNIGLVNEMAVLAHEMGLDIGEIIEAAATKPYGFQAFQPGVGPGGACIPEDPLYLAAKARELEVDTRLIDLAAGENQGMARYVVFRILELMSRRGAGLRGARVLCVGAGYKPGVSDTRHSRALRVMALLERAGALVSYSDPLIASVEVGGRQLKSVPLEGADPGEVDLVAVLVAQPSLDLSRFLDRGVPVFDAAHAVARADGVERL